MPVNRVAVASVGNNLASFRPYNALERHHAVRLPRRVDYDSLQLTLSRQTGKRLQYFVAYTLRQDAAARSAASTRRSIPYDPSRTYGVLDTDRTHILNVSWNAFLPDGARGEHGQRGRARRAQRLAALGHLVAGERHPVPPQLRGRRGERASIAAAYFGTADVVGPSNSGGNGLAPVYTCDPRSAARTSARRCSTQLHLACRRSARTAIWCRRTTSGTPTRINHDLTLFKNFAINGDQKIQFRVGFFNLFNQAFANTSIDGNDINLMLDTTCNVLKDDVPNGTGNTVERRLRPDAGFNFTPQTMRQLREDQPQARPPRGRVRPEVLLLEPGRRRIAGSRRRLRTSPAWL